MFSFFCLFRLWSDVAVQEFAQFHLNRSKTYKAGTTDELLKGWLSSSTHPLGSSNFFFFFLKLFSDNQMNTATNNQFVTGGSVFVFPLSSRFCSGPPVLNQIGSAGYYLIKRVDPPFISLALQRGPDTKTEPVRPAEGRTLQLCSSAALLSVLQLCSVFQTMSRLKHGVANRVEHLVRR